LNAPTGTKEYLKKGCYGSKKVDGLTASQRYYRRHREACLQMAEIYKQGHKTEVNAKMREYRKKHPDSFAAYEQKRVRPEDHQGKFNAYSNQYHKDHPDERLAVYQNRRARLAGSTGEVFSEELVDLRNKQKGRCFYCGKELDNKGRGHTDHKTPLSKRGEHAIQNIVFACSRCNLKKGTKTAEEFLCCSR